MLAHGFKFMLFSRLRKDPFLFSSDFSKNESCISKTFFFWQCNNLMIVMSIMYILVPKLKPSIPGQYPIWLVHNLHNVRQLGSTREVQAWSQEVEFKSRLKILHSCRALDKSQPVGPSFIIYKMEIIFHLSGF